MFPKTLSDLLTRNSRPVEKSGRMERGVISFRWKDGFKGKPQKLSPRQSFWRDCFQLRLAGLGPRVTELCWAVYSLTGNCSRLSESPNVSDRCFANRAFTICTTSRAFDRYGTLLRSAF